MQGLSKFFLQKPQHTPKGNFSLLEPLKEKNELSSSNEDYGSLDDYHWNDLIGTGTFGRVYKVKSKKTSKEYAIKLLKKSTVVQMKQLEHVKDEIQILMSLRHPFIIRLYKTFSDFNSIYLLMEISSGGEFFALLRSLNRLDREATKFYAAEMVLVLEYLHENSIAYRDLKPENVLLAPDGHIKICDFGFSKVVVDRTWTLCGTPEYLSPEVIMGVGHDKSVDWWALGVLVYEMYAGYPPFYGDQPIMIYEKICEGRYKFPHHFEDDVRDLISKLLCPSKSRRLGNLVGGAKDVKDHPFFKGMDWVALLSKSIKPPLSASLLEKCRVESLDEEEESEEENESDGAIYDNYFKDFDFK